MAVRAFDLIARARARHDYKSGEGEDSSPYIKGTETDKAWRQEMERLFDQEEQRSYWQGIAESHIPE